MASTEHLRLLEKGANAWNAWREANPQVLVNLAGAALAETTLRAVNLTKVDLSGADMRHALLRDARIADANLTGARLEGANLLDAQLSDTNLFGAGLRGAHLLRARLLDVNLQGANLNDARLDDASLEDVDLRGAKLRNVAFIRSSMRHTDLRGADLRSADLMSSIFQGVLLDDADFHSALLGATVFAATGIGKARNLQNCRHLYASQLDFESLTRFPSPPEIFLRGCGLPDKLIEYLPSLSHQAIQFYSCFISYASGDQVFADRLFADLQSKGVRCWFAPHHMSAGMKLHEQIDEAIRVHDKLLLVLSKASMESEWVKTEIAKARRREMREGRRMLFPVRLVDFERLRDWECFDADAGKDSAREVREYYVPDFSNWKDHDSYQKEFAKLLKDLKNDGSV